MGPGIRLSRTAQVLAAALLAVILAGCGTAVGAGAARAAPSTTTTLPTPDPLAATRSGGTLSFLGSVARLAVHPVPDGLEGAPAPVVGSPAWAKEVTIGFRSFGSGPALLLIMGAHGTMTWWPPSLLAMLAQHFTVTIFDLPGVGYSTDDAGRPMTVPWLADVTAGLIDELGLARPTVLGWGMGGQVALELAARDPGLASALVLVDTSEGGPNAAHAAGAVRGVLADPWATPTELAGLLFPSSDTAAENSYLADIAQLAPDDIVGRTIVRQAAAEAAYEAAGATRSDLAPVTVPVLVIAGGSDRVFPPAGTAHLGAVLPDVDRSVLPNAGYGALFEDEAQCVELIELFLGPVVPTT